MKQADHDTFVISDTHFSHDNIIKFLKEDGTRVRPEFNSTDEMNEFIVQQWNSVVKPNDKVYHLGDVTMKKKYIDIVKRLNGRKRLILGNHDIFGFQFYADYFDEVYAMRFLQGEHIMMTHVPIQMQSVKRGYVNVHGHIHQKVIVKDERMIEAHISQQHPKYFCACVEHHNYTPVSLDIIRDYVKKLTVDQFN